MTTQAFVDRRHDSAGSPQVERRQFGNSYEELSPAARELGLAVDRYKLMNRRRYVTYEELLDVIENLGYAKDAH